MLLLKAIKKQNAVYENVLSRMAIVNNKSKTENRRNRLKFTQKEILRMPTQYRSFFAANDMIVRYRYASQE